MLIHVKYHKLYNQIEDVICMAGDLKYRIRFTTSVDKGLYKALYNHSIDSKIPLSRLADEAIEDFLKKNNLQYTVEAPYKKEKL